MSGPSTHTTHHPRWLRPRMSTWWWLKRRAHLSFILRELSSVFVAWFVVYFLLLVRAVNEGAAAYGELLAWSARPLVLGANVVALAFVTYHAITWFNLAPKAMVVRVGGKRVPAALIAGSNYVAWAVASVGVAWLLLGG
jgi:fumarate reductase subunit C